MCYFCDGSSADYQAYLSSVKDLRSQVVDKASFLQRAGEADRLRFSGSPEWSEAPIAERVRRLIFCNPNPDEGLLLFILAAWLDLQAPYTRVWNQMLKQANTWISGAAWTDPTLNIPRGRFKPVRPHLLKTVATLSTPSYDKSVATWFATIVSSIAKRFSIRRGNLYRFVGAICRDLYEAKDGSFTSWMDQGALPGDYRGTHYKRLWMLIMFLKKDQSAIRCLIRRALDQVPGGVEAREYWEDEAYFDPGECELPVDTRVLSAWEELPFSSPSHGTVEAVAREARALARSATVAPTSFDALLFFR